MLHANAIDRPELVAYQLAPRHTHSSELTLRLQGSTREAGRFEVTAKVQSGTPNTTDRMGPARLRYGGTEIIAERLTLFLPRLSVRTGNRRHVLGDPAGLQIHAHRGLKSARIARHGHQPQIVSLRDRHAVSQATSGQEH